MKLFAHSNDEFLIKFINLRARLNIAGIENYSNLQDILPLCWSTPSLGNAIRRDLEPPVVQQATFDDTVSLISFTQTHRMLNMCILFDF